MAIKSVKMMREIRDKMNQRIEGMVWEDESTFLEKHITTFSFLLKERSYHHPHGHLNVDNRKIRAF